MYREPNTVAPLVCSTADTRFVFYFAAVLSKVITRATQQSMSCHSCHKLAFTISQRARPLETVQCRSHSIEGTGQAILHLLLKDSYTFARLPCQQERALDPHVLWLLSLVKLVLHLSSTDCAHRRCRDSKTPARGSPGS